MKYLIICANDRAQKEDPDPVLFLISAYLINYQVETYTLSVDLTIDKILLNSVIYKTGASLIWIYSSKNYLVTALKTKWLGICVYPWVIYPQINCGEI